jgi:putative sugar O-methyltransferase
MALVYPSMSLFRNLNRLLEQWARKFSFFTEDSWPAVTGFHGLRDNEDLTDKEFQECVGIVQRVEALHSRWVPYTESKGLAKEVFFPANEWQDIVDPKGPFNWQQDYVRVNHLRVHCPFTGYWLLLLDRVDQFRKFPDDWSVPYALKIVGEPVSVDVLDELHARFNPLERVEHSIEDFKAHALTVPSELRFRAPKFFGEMGAICGDYVVNDDIVIVQARVNAMFALGVIDKLQQDVRKKGFCRVIEIGAGIGQQAAALKQIFGDALQYIVIDLPPSLVASALYLSRLAKFRRSYVLEESDSWPESFEFVFLANYLTEQFRGHLGPADLVMNTMSFGEMSGEQIRYYAELASELVGTDGFLYEENCQVLSHHVSVLDILGESFRERTDLASRKVLVRHGCHRLWSNQNQHVGAHEVA